MGLIRWGYYSDLLLGSLGGSLNWGYLFGGALYEGFHYLGISIGVPYRNNLPMMENQMKKWKRNGSGVFVGVCMVAHDNSWPQNGHYGT